MMALTMYEWMTQDEGEMVMQTNSHQFMEADDAV